MYGEPLDIFKEYLRLSNSSALAPLNDFISSEFATLFTDNWGLENSHEAKIVSDYRDLVMSGCSETEGRYLSESAEEDNKLVWSSIVGDALGASNIQLGMGGGSIFAIVDRYISHCSRVGHPKIALFLLPPLDSRYMVIADRSICVSKNEPWNRITSITLDSDKPHLLSKVPHKYEEITPPVQALLYSIKALKWLETICQLAGTELLYTTWDAQSEDFLVAVNAQAAELGCSTPFPSYIKNNPADWNNINYSGCHEDELKDSGSVFYIGTDGWHMGAHRQKHIAELFINNLTN